MSPTSSVSCPVSTSVPFTPVSIATCPYVRGKVPVGECGFVQFRIETVFDGKIIQEERLVLNRLGESPPEGFIAVAEGDNLETE